MRREDPTADADIAGSDRLATLERSGLLDSPPEASFDRLTGLVARFLRAPVALISLVDADRQFFKSCVGLPEPWASRRETPLSHSFCQHVVAAGDPLIIEDAREHPLVRGNGAITDLGVIAYLGVPLTMPGGEVLGSLCAIDDRPRRWAGDDVETMKSLAGSVMAEILLRGELAERRAAERLARRSEEKAIRAMQAAEAANRAKDDFLASLSHELRTPLTPALLGLAELERDEAIDPLTRRRVGVIRRNVEAESRLIDDLLDLTRIARGKLELRPEEVDLGEVLGRAVETCRAEIEARELAVALLVETDRTAVRGDPGRLEQVVRNLLSNAAKFTPAGGRITVRAEDSGADRVRVRVADTGVGIEPERLSRIFEAFEQGGRETTRRFGGLGLGLAISRALVEAHGGRLSAESAGRGRGATFSIELAASGAPTRLAPGEDRGTGAPGTALPLRILLVEDHEDSARILSRMLRRSGYEIVTAGSVSEALRAAAAGPFDLLVSDLGLPDGSGLELMERLRPLPGIALTGYGMETDLLKTREAGFVAHLVKPIDVDDLERAIFRVSQAHAARV